MALALTTVGAASETDRFRPLSKKRSAKIEKKWGIEIESLRTTAVNTMIDFRYRVVDPAKAIYFVDRTHDAYLVDQSSGIAFGVPSSGKIGPMRQTLRFGEPPADRVLFVLFGNPGGTIRSGSRVTIHIGDFKVKNLVVQ